MALEVGGKRIVRRRRAGGGYELGPSRGDKDEYSAKKGSLAAARARRTTTTTATQPAPTTLASAPTTDRALTPTREAEFAMTGSAGFISLARRREAEAQGYGFASVPYSTEAGEGVQATGYTVTGSSQERPEVLRYARLQDQQRTLGLTGTTPQRISGRIATGLSQYATRQYAAADGSTITGGARIFAGDVATAIRDPFARYAYGDTTLGRDITVGYAIGGAAGFGSQSLITAAGRYGAGTGTALNVGRGLRYARGAQIGLGTVGVGLTGTYLATSSPQRIGQDLPLFAAGGFGYARGARLAATPALTTQTTTQFLGIAEATPAPKTTPYRTPEGAFAFTSQQTRQNVYSVFGRPTLGTSTTRTGFLGQPLVPGQIYQGPIGLQRTDLIPGRVPYVASQSQQGTMSLDIGRGIYGFTTPQQQTVGIVTSQAGAAGGWQQITSAQATRSAMGYTGTVQQSLISPDTTIRVPSVETMSFRQGTQALQVSAPRITQETSFNVYPLTSRGPRSLSAFETESLMAAAGFQRPVGVPRTSVQPRALYSDPTGGILTQITTGTPRSVPRTWQPSGSGINIPGPGTGLVPPRTQIIAPPTTFIGFGGRSAGGSRSATGTILDPITRIIPGTTPTRPPGLDTGTTPIITPITTPRTRLTPSLTPRQGRTPFPPTIPGFYPPSTPTRTPPPPPGLGLPSLPLFGISGAGGSGGSRPPAGTYNPSLVSIFGDITGPEVDILTGLEVRPRRKRTKKK